MGVRMKKPEILAPAGSMDALKMAVVAGADAVYLGGDRFGARAYANNFSKEELIEGINYCHLYDVKVYLTVNTLFRDDEMEQLYAYLQPFYCAGLDAVIVQDLGVVAYIYHCFPDLPIHASTQMAITTPYAYEFLKELGVTRIVPARELSFDELKTLKQGKNFPELEVFVQGALCYCYSGHCLMSSFIGGRSGNRGRCAQPCRLQYTPEGELQSVQKTEQYLLSPKDLCGLHHVKTLMEMGIDSFKIEGRMKKPSYVAACVLAYRRVVDACFDREISDYLIEQEKRNMASVFNRGGFTSGYFKTKNGKQMMSMDFPGNAGVYIGKVIGKKKNQIQIQLKETVHKGDLLALNVSKNIIHLTCNIEKEAGNPIVLNTSNVKSIAIGDVVVRLQDVSLESRLQMLIQNGRKRIITGRIELVTGKPASLELQSDKASICVKGSMVEPASNQPVSKELVQEKMMQLGNTDFQLEKLEVIVSPDAFYSMKELKNLRREGIDALKEKILSCDRRMDSKLPDFSVVDYKEEQLSGTPIVQIASFSQMEAVASYEILKDVYIDLQYFSIEDIMELLKKYQNHDFYVVLFPVFRQEMEKEIDKVLSLTDENLKGIVVRNLDEYAYLMKKDYKKTMITDYSLYTMNRYAGDLLKGRNTLPVELNERELQALIHPSKSYEMIVYGYQQLMVSAQCVSLNTKGCQKKNDFYIFRDRYDKPFFVKTVCRYCYNLIYNGIPTVLFDVKSPLLNKGNIRHRLIFTMENKKQTMDVLQQYWNEGVYHGQRTKGHFSRGVE